MVEIIGIIIGVTMVAAVAIWVFYDANSRGMNAWAWAGFTFLLLIIGLPIYMTSRKPKIGKDV